MGRGRSVRNAILLGLGLGATVIVMIGLERLLPPVVPSPVAVAALHKQPIRKSVRPQSTPKVSPSEPKPNAAGLIPISYGGYLAQIRQMGKQMGLRVWLARYGVPPVVFQESYREGSQLDLLYSNMIVIESQKVLRNTYRPASIVGATLSNGTPAQWQWIPGVGGPSHRLMFKLGRTYIRLEMEPTPSKNALQTAVSIASAFSSTTALG